MGTRGLFGFYYKSKFYVAYNHWDSYPEDLGKTLVQEISEAIKNGQLDQWIEMLDKIKLISMDVIPTIEDIQKLKPYIDLSVSSRCITDWYCLLRRTQGSMVKVLKSGYMNNCVDDNGRPLFEEYAYILNFNTNKFDFYEGNECVQSYELSNLPKW